MGKSDITQIMTEEDKAKIEKSICPVYEEQEAHPISGRWPEPLSEEAFYGLAGDIVKVIEPETEAAPAALLISFLVMFGNCIDRRAHFIAEADRHYMNLFACLVGTTSKGRKGVSFNHIRKLFLSVDPDWAQERILQGMSSGEGLIWAVRDEQITTKTNKEGEEVEIKTDQGVTDKRLTTVEQEFASTIRVLRREGNTLSAVTRKAWDDGSLNTLVKNNPAKATDAHVSILAHITKDELLRYLDSTEYGNGFGNRFLWVCVRRSKCLPEGGNLHEEDLADITKRLDNAVRFGKATGEIKRDPDARLLWFEVYPKLSEGIPGLCGSMLARAEAQVMRIACIYALLDLSAIITVKHLEAALAVWEHCEASAKFIFGENLGDPEADDIKEALHRAGIEGMTRTQLSQLFGRNKPAKDINRALNLLTERGLVYFNTLTNTGGRPIEKWYISNPVTK